MNKEIFSFIKSFGKWTYQTLTLGTPNGLIELVELIIMLSNSLIDKDRRLITLLILFQQRVLPLRTQKIKKINKIKFGNLNGITKGVMKSVPFQWHESERGQYGALRLCVSFRECRISFGTIWSRKGWVLELGASWLWSLGPTYSSSSSSSSSPYCSWCPLC